MSRSAVQSAGGTHPHPSPAGPSVVSPAGVQRPVWAMRADLEGALPHERDRWCANHGCSPVVVIDPEDREQVERLWGLLRGTVRDGAMLRSSDNLQAALREFANPTPPKCDAGLSIHGKSYTCDDLAGHAGSIHHHAASGAIWDGGSQ